MSINNLGFAVCYGFFMKMADLSNEHGLKLFYGSNMVFGFFLGIFWDCSVHWKPNPSQRYLSTKYGIYCKKSPGLPQSSNGSFNDYYSICMEQSSV